MPRWRKMTWVLIIWSALILIWAIAGGGSVATDCANEATRSARNACEAGAGIGILLIFVIGFFGFMFFGLIWFMTRPKTRACPRCGEDVKKGTMDCKSCGFDFKSVGTSPAQASGVEGNQQ